MGGGWAEPVVSRACTAAHWPTPNSPPRSSSDLQGTAVLSAAGFRSLQPEPIVLTTGRAHQAEGFHKRCIDKCSILYDLQTYIRVCRSLRGKHDERETQMLIEAEIRGKTLPRTLHPKTTKKLEMATGLLAGTQPGGVEASGC